LEQREVHRRVAYVGAPTRMRSNAMGGGTRTLCLAWEVAIMMPLQGLACVGGARLKLFSIRRNKI
jgi:hypothetical protein